MRALPKLWPKHERIQWGCTLMRLVGEESLEHLHILLAGLRSVERSAQTISYERAIHTARVILGDLLTKNAVQNAVYDYIADAEHKSYRIDPKTLAFSPEFELDPNIAEAEAILQRGLERKQHALTVADPSKDLVVKLDEDTRVPIRLHGLQFPPIQRHDLNRRPKDSIQVRFDTLKCLAQELDAEDARLGRPSQFWVTRVDMIRLQCTTGHGLRDADLLDLADLKHLIGLPGAGKSTLIALLCILLARENRRIAVFFTSIEVARDYLETLRRYDIRVALLMGRSSQTHRRHANRMAELIAGQGDGGFGHTREGAELFAGSCPLPAFADTWPAHWQVGDAPCEEIYEDGSDERKLCPAWELCGRVKNQRELVQANVWLGHILSADTTVPAHTSEDRLRYFELIAETFDLVIFDECDETQKMLDGHGALTLELTGNDQSMHMRIQSMTELLAANRAKVSDGLLRYFQKANEFERHMLRFIVEIRALSNHKLNHRLASEYADKLLTAGFLIREALLAAGSYSQFDSKGLSALLDFWERAMYQAFFRSENTKGWPKVEKYAPVLGIDHAEANRRWLDVHGALKQYLALDHAAAADDIIDRITADLAWLWRADDSSSIREHVRLLIAVGFTVASYQRLAKAARPLAQRGELDPKLVFAQASTEIRELVPRSILGTFSAVRYRRATEQNGFEIDYIVMDSTPRMLMHRLHEFGRTNVLLASATSWLEKSTEFHVDKKPDYVLSPNSDEIGSVRLYALPKLHPITRQPLRFSGGNVDREDNLRHMVAALAQPNAGGPSELEAAVMSITTELGKRRMAALVVNSYQQVQLVVEQIYQVNPALAERTRGVLGHLPKDPARSRYILKGQVEELGQSPDVDVVVFPIAALGRGVNIVFKGEDDDRGKAAVGSVYFLTRPHPAAGDLSLMVSLLARHTQSLDQRDFADLSLDQVRHIYDVERFKTYKRIANLLARPLSASRLDDLTLWNFAANVLVPILQTIGRGMRKRMPVEVYFVDAAWAPHSAERKPETIRSSVLVLMRDVLEECLTHSDPDLRDVYQALYGVFLDAFRNIVNLCPSESGESRPIDDGFEPSTSGTEDNFDDFDPDADNSDSEEEDPDDALFQILQEGDDEL